MPIQQLLGAGGAAPQLDRIAQARLCILIAQRIRACRINCKIACHRRQSHRDVRLAVIGRNMTGDPRVEIWACECGETCLEVLSRNGLRHQRLAIEIQRDGRAHSSGRAKLDRNRTFLLLRLDFSGDQIFRDVALRIDGEALQQIILGVADLAIGVDGKVSGAGVIRIRDSGRRILGQHGEIATPGDGQISDGVGRHQLTLRRRALNSANGCARTDSDP